MTTILSYGGGRQTVAICVLIARGVLPKPDRIVMADTGRENASTWAYLAAHVQPMLGGVGLSVEIAPRSLATVDLYSHNGILLIPAFADSGKFSSWCSGEWKRDVVGRYLKSEGVSGGEKWIGFALEERKRVARLAKSEREPNWSYCFPLVDLMLTTDGCASLVKSHGLPPAPHSSCWMCPNKRNAEWKALTPEEFAAACDLDDELRADDIFKGGTGVYLHYSRVPLRTADLDTPEKTETARQCGLGMCFV